MLILLTILLWQTGFGTGSQRTITIPVVIGHDSVSFDDGRISEEQVRRWIMLSPHVSASNSYLVPEPLNLCIEGRPEYRDCGTRNWAAKNFVFNANVNLQKIRDRIKQLDEGAYPKELRPIVSYFRRIQEDSLVFNSQLLKFIQEGLTEDLGKSFDGIDPMQQCPAEIAKIRSATDKNDVYRLAYYGWGNCINRGLRAKVGKYPKADWDEFLHYYSIREHFIEDDVD